MNAHKSFLGMGVFTAIASSICCITPVLALLAGTSGIAATFSWIEPLRPYLIVISLGVLALAWYQKIKPKQSTQVECACETSEAKRTSFWHTKKFLLIVTLVSGLLLSFPYYASAFYPSNGQPNKGAIINKGAKITTVEFQITGMTCPSCGTHIEHEVNKLKGIHKVSVSYAKKQAIVEFDQDVTSLKKLITTINKTGYKVVKHKIKTT